MVTIKKYLKSFLETTPFESCSSCISSEPITPPFGSLVNIEVIISFWSNCTKLIRGIPFAVLPYSGISKILVLNTLPLFVKSKSSSCVLQSKTCSMKSPSLVSPPEIPFPPLCCVWYVEGGTLLTYPE